MREAGELKRALEAAKGFNGTNMLRKEEKVATIIRLSFFSEKC